MDKVKAFLKKLQFWKKDGDQKPKNSEKKKEAKDARPKMRRGWRWTFITLIWVAALLPWLIFWLWLKSAGSDGMPSTKELENPRSKEASEIYSSDGELMGKYYAENRTPVNFSDLSPYLVDALISTEDERYMEHPGIDVKSIPRVVKGVVSGESSAGGGSTITQQLAKMLFSERDFGDMGKWDKLKALVDVKLKEWIMATELERKFTKEEIITMYFNKFDFLNNAVGVHSAARVYFNTTPDSLTMEQAAMLVGMAKNPSYFNPRRHPERTKGRRNQVLKQWLRNSNKDNKALKFKITQAQCDSLMKLPMELDYQEVDHQSGIAPYFREILREAVVDTLAKMYMRDYRAMQRVLSESEYKDFTDSLKVIKDNNGKGKKYRKAKKELIVRWSKYMIYNKGLRIYTTIDGRMQRYAEESVKQWLGSKLQAEMEKQQKKRLKEEWPFDYTGNQDGKYLTKEERLEKIAEVMDRGMRRSDRWKNMRARGVSETKRIESFHKPIPMKVFSWQGDIDTVMTPWDSIRYYKQFFQAGMMSMDPNTGFVKAWVGGTDFYHFKYDHVIKSRRQVGSTIKPFVYATALDLGIIDPCTEIPNVPYCVDQPHTKRRDKSWCPKGSTYDEEYVSMTYGLAGSMNNITAWVMNEIGQGNGTGPEIVKKRIADLGIDTGYVDAVPALCLGIPDLQVYEMVGAQSTFVNRGLYTRPIIINRVEDKLGNVIYDSDPQMKEVFSEDVAYLTLQLMKGVMRGARRRDGKAAGTAAGIRSTYYDWGGITQPMAGKTGTTQNGSDGWFMGLTPDLVTGVWVGAEDRSVHFPTIAWGQGGRMALPIYGFYMQKVYADKSIKISQKDFEKPSIPLSDELWNCRFDKDPEGRIDYGGDDGTDPDDPDGEWIIPD